MPFDENDKPAEEVKEILDMLGEEETPPSEEEEEEKKEEKTEEEPEEEEEEESKKEPEKKEEEPEEEEEEEEEENKEEETISLTKEQLAEKEELAVLRAEKLTREKVDKEKPPEKPKEPDIVEYVSTEDSEALLNEDGSINAEKINLLMNKIVNIAVTNSLKAIPEVVGRQVNEATTNKQIIDDFYREHPGLKPHRPYIGFKANELAAKKPELTLRELLAETAEIVKNELSITEEAEDKESKRKKPKTPRTPKGGGEKETSKRTDLQSEIDEMDEQQ